MIRTLLILFLVFAGHCTFHTPSLSAGITFEKRPLIFLEYSTRRIPLDYTKVKMIVDAKDVTTLCEINPSRISYRPKEDLADGVHNVSVTLVDKKGNRREKRWSFMVDSKNKVPEFSFKVSKPSPKNGAVLNRDGIIFRYKIEGVPAKDVNLDAYMAEGTSGYKRLSENALVEGEFLSLELGHLSDGPKTILVKLTHKNGGPTLESQSSFLVNQSSARFIQCLVQPSPLSLNLDHSPMISVVTEFSDPPYHTAAELSLNISGPEGDTIKLKRKDVLQKHIFKFSSERVKQWPAGLYEVELFFKDYNGRTIKNREPCFLELRGGNSISSDDIHIIPYPKVTRNFELNISGHTLAQSVIALYVGEEFVTKQQTTFINGQKSSFNFKGIPLREGFNPISFQLFNLEGQSIGERRTYPGVLLDHSPPIIKLISPEQGEEASEFSKIEFSVKDFSNNSIDNNLKAYSGLHIPSVKLKLNQTFYKLKNHEQIFSAIIEKPLGPGKHKLMIYAEDRLGNAITRNSSFNVIPGEPFILKAESNKQKLFSWGEEQAVITVSLKDKFSRNVADGTPIFFSASKGLIPKIARTENGLAKVRYIPGLQLGSSTVKIWTATGGLKKTINFQITNTPKRIPFSSTVIQSIPSIPADNGKSQITFKAVFKDALGQYVSNGLPVQVTSELGEVDKQQAIIKNGGIIFNYKAKKAFGTEYLKLKVMAFKKVITFPITEPKPGPPHHFEIKLSPDHAIAGSVLPIRLEVSVYDELNLPVKDSTIVSFKTDLGHLPEKARVFSGKVINNFRSPEEPGLATISIQSGKAKQSIKVPILIDQRSQKVSKIWLKKLTSHKLGAAPLKIEGQVLGDKDELIKGNRQLFVQVSQGKAPSMVVVRKGVFQFEIEPNEAGKLNIELHCDEQSISEDITILKASTVEEIAEEKQNGISALAASLNLEFQKTSLHEDLISGYLVIDLIPHQKKGVKLSDYDGTIININSKLGDVVPKAYLVAGKARVPLNYRKSGEEIWVNANINKNIRGNLIITETQPLLATPAEVAILNPPKQASARFSFNLGKVQGRRVPITLTLRDGLIPAPTVEFKAQFGKILSGKTRTWFGDQVSFTYLLPESGNKDTITARCGGIRETLDIDLEKLRDPSKGNPALALQEQKNELLELRKGVKVVHLSGKTRLEAGGKDRTRMRFQLLNFENQDLKDGTIVDIFCSQASINPNRVRVRRGIINFSVRSKNWVGTYPLIMRVGDVRKKFDISFHAPAGDENALPDFPDRPNKRNNRRKRF